MILVETYSRLPEPVKSLAIANAVNQGVITHYIGISPSGHNGHVGYFGWNRAFEGPSFWSSVHYKIETEFFRRRHVMI